MKHCDIGINYLSSMCMKSGATKASFIIMVCLAIATIAYIAINWWKQRKSS